MSKKKGWRSVYGSFLKAVDLPKEGQKFTIEKIDEQEIGQEKKPSLVAKLSGTEKRWVMNATNCEALEEMFGSDDPDSWEGKRVTLFNDRTVTNPKGGPKGGIRIKPAKTKKAAADDDEDDVDRDLEELEDEDDDADDEDE